MSERTFSFYAKDRTSAPPRGQSTQPTFIARDLSRRHDIASTTCPDRRHSDRLLHPQFQTYNVSHFQERQIKVNSSVLLSDGNNNHKQQAEDTVHRIQEQRSSNNHPGSIHSSTQLVVKPSSNRIPVSVEIHTPISASIQSNIGHRSHSHHNPHKRQRTASSASSSGMTIYTILGDSQYMNSHREPESGAVTRNSPEHPTPSARGKLGSSLVPSHLMNGRPPGHSELSGKSLETIAEEQQPASKHVRIDLDSVSGTTETLTPSRNVKVAGKSFLSPGQNESGEEIEALPLDQNSKRRRSSLLSLDLFFRNRIASAPRASVGQSNRTSIISRLSFSSEYDPTIRVTNFNKLTDLRRILNPEEEKEDWLDVFWAKFNTCDWFEWNLNNAAKLITLAVFVVTILLIIRTIVHRM